MVTAQDLENARRIWVAAMGTDRGQAAKTDYMVLLAQAKREHRVRRAS